MKRATTTPAQLPRLLFSPCTCILSLGLQCLACARWRQHYRTVLQRTGRVSRVSEHLRRAAR